MELEAMLTALLMAAALTCAIGVCLPDVLLLLGLTRVRRGVVGGPEQVHSGSGELLSAELAAQLEALGFAPAGLYWEQLPAHKLFKEAIYVARTGDCFAAVYHLLNDDPSRVAFKTSFGDGAFVLTQNYDGGMEVNEDTLRAGGLPCGEARPLAERLPLGEVLAEHRRRVRRFVQAGHDPLPAVTIEDHVEAEWAYMNHPTVRREYRGSVATLFALKLAFLISGPGLLALFGFGAGVLSALLLAEALVVLMLRYYDSPLLAALDRILPAEKSH